MQNNAYHKKYQQFAGVDKSAARRRVSTAIRIGKLTKQPCETCGIKKVHAHHDDYSKPLEVKWFCTKHHAKIHVELRKKKS